MPSVRPPAWCFWLPSIRSASLDLAAQRGFGDEHELVGGAEVVAAAIRHHRVRGHVEGADVVLRGLGADDTDGVAMELP